MESIRCGTCRRKLAEAEIRDGRIAIKCRCGTINRIERAPSPEPERQPIDRAHRAGAPRDSP